MVIPSVTIPARLRQEEEYEQDKYFDLLYRLRWEKTRLDKLKGNFLRHQYRIIEEVKEELEHQGLVCRYINLRIQWLIDQQLAERAEYNAVHMVLLTIQDECVEVVGFPIPTTPVPPSLLPVNL